MQPAHGYQGGIRNFFSLKYSAVETIYKESVFDYHTGTFRSCPVYFIQICYCCIQGLECCYLWQFWFPTQYHIVSTSDML